MTTFEWFLSLGRSLDVAIVGLSLIAVLVVWRLVRAAAIVGMVLLAAFAFFAFGGSDLGIPKILSPFLDAGNLRAAGDYLDVAREAAADAAAEAKARSVECLSAGGREADCAGGLSRDLEAAARKLAAARSKVVEIAIKGP